MAAPTARVAKAAHVLVLMAMACAAVVCAAASPPCFCDDESLCALVDVPDRWEVFGFSVNRFDVAKYPMDKVTTICTFDNVEPQSVCLAHRNKVKMTFGAGYDPSQLHNATVRGLRVCWRRRCAVVVVFVIVAVVFVILAVAVVFVIVTVAVAVFAVVAVSGGCCLCESLCALFVCPSLRSSSTSQSS
jgi:hypothetical protein